MRKLVILFILCRATIDCVSQQEDSIMIRRIADEILINGKAYNNLHDLTKKIGARLSGSPQLAKAEQWGLKTMQESGADKVWLQECMIPHWIRGGKDKAEARYISGKKLLDVLALGNSIGTGSKGITAAVIEVKSFDDLESKKAELKDKIVFYNYKFNPTFIRTFQAYVDAVQYH